MPRLSIVPATIDLIAFEQETSGVGSRHYRLRDVLAAVAASEDDATYVLIDCPPSLNLLTVNALVAAETMVGRDGVTAHALPHDRLLETMGRFGRADRPA